MTIIGFLLWILAAYAGAGFVAALAFVTAGADQVQPMPLTWGARVLLFPAAAALWPWLIYRWYRTERPRP